MIVLDTNVVSELMRAVPDPRVVTWVGLQPAGDVLTTAVTLAEVDYGIVRLPAGRRRDVLRTAADEVFTAFADRLLPFDAAAAVHYGGVVVERERAGAPVTSADAQIAAICRSRRARLATRNTSDFDHLELDVVDPWA